MTMSPLPMIGARPQWVSCSTASSASEGLVQDAELESAIEFIDWYQYFSPRVVERLGRERVLSAPAFKIIIPWH